MEEYNPQPNQPYNGMQQPLPNATVSLILGILSIPACCGYGITGLILGIVAIVLGNKDARLYMANPEMYTVASYNNSKAGKICGIIGVVLGSLYVLIIILVIAMFGTMILTDPQHFREIMQQRYQ